MAYPSPWLAARPPGTAQKKDAGRGGVRSPARRPGPWRTLFRIGTGPSACARQDRSEEHTSELQSRVDSSYAVFCLKKNIIVLYPCGVDVPLLLPLLSLRVFEC